MQPEQVSNQKFSLGHLHIMPGILSALPPNEIADAVRRHASGDWGEVDAHDREQNEFSLESGLRILSAYRYRDVRVWVITEGDRSSTTVLLPEEY